MYHAYMGFLFIYTHTCTHMYIQILQSLENLSFFQKDKNRAEENVLPTSYDKSTTTFPIFQDYPWAMKMMEKNNPRMQQNSRIGGERQCASAPNNKEKPHISSCFKPDLPKQTTAIIKARRQPWFFLPNDNYSPVIR